MTAARDHGPGVRIPPPVIVAVLLGAAWGAMQLLPLPLMAPWPEAGWVAIAAGGALAVWTAAVMLLAGTDPRPDKPDAAMVQTGPFRLSRNPIYLGFLVAAAGVALRWGDGWGWIGVVACFLVLDRLVIAKEEAYLRARFGAAYEDYRARVRRWV